jgi:uncharacterized protein (TIGR02996 family)
MARKLSEREALLASVYETPDDDAPRLVYADWLEEHGDEADQDRAAFIRAGCRVARLPLDAPERVSAEIQAEALLNRHKAAWKQELPATVRVRFVQFERGFAFGIRATAAELLRSGGALSRRTAVQEVNIEANTDEQMARLAASPLLGRLRSLPGVNVDRAVRWCSLLSAPALGGLQRLGLDVYLVGRQPGMRRLLELPTVRRVRALDFNCYYTASEAEPRRRALEEFAQTDFPELRYFRLRLSDQVSVGELAILLRAAFLAGLDELHVDCMLSPEGAGLLGGVPGAGSLRALTALTSEQAAPAFGAALSGWSFPSLSQLQLNRADDEAVRRLAERPFAPNLRILDLFAHSLTPAGAEELSSGRFSRLVWLGLWNGGVSDDCLRALAASPGLPELRYLDLHGANVTQEGLDALAASPHLPRLEAVAVGEYQSVAFPPEWVGRYAHRFLVLPPPLGFLSPR